MNTQQTSNPAVILCKAIGIGVSILGYAIVFIFGLTLLFGKLDNAASVIVAILFIVIGVLLIIGGIKTKKTIQRFNKYVSMICLENQTSIENIASASSQSIDFVTKDLQTMINIRFFTNAYIDKNTNEIVLTKNNITAKNSTSKKTEDLDIKVVTCKNCGASNNITSKSTAECEFCGSAL